MQKNDTDTVQADERSEPIFGNVQGDQESIPLPIYYVAWQAGTTNRVIVPGRQATQAGRIDSLKLIPGLLKRLRIRPQFLSDG
jgi:hypothetical protein